MESSILTRSNASVVSPLVGSPKSQDTDPIEDNGFYNISGGVARYDARTLQLAQGDPVAAWADASEQLGDAVQDVTARQPTYSAALPGVVFPGGGAHHLRLPNQLAFDEFSAFTIVCLVNRHERSAPTGMLFGLGEIAGGQPWGVYHLTLGRASSIISGTQEISVSDAWPVGLGVIDLTMQGFAGTFSLDGVQLVPTTNTSDVPTQAVAPSMGANLSPGGAVSLPLTGTVHDIMFFDRALSPAEHSTLRAALNQDWGI
ncbi:MAG: hypothetical protein ACF8MF_06565 [Phycisphaerales bacterium JB052]